MHQDHGFSYSLTHGHCMVAGVGAVVSFEEGSQLLDRSAGWPWKPGSRAEELEGRAKAHRPPAVAGEPVVREFP